MKTTLCNVTIDEVTIVFSLNLAYMHLRLEELFGSNERIGSKICSVWVIFSYM